MATLRDIHFLDIGFTPMTARTRTAVQAAGGADNEALAARCMR